MLTLFVFSGYYSHISTLADVQENVLVMYYFILTISPQKLIKSAVTDFISNILNK